VIFMLEVCLKRASMLCSLAFLVLMEGTESQVFRGLGEVLGEAGRYSQL